MVLLYEYYKNYCILVEIVYGHIKKTNMLRKCINVLHVYLIYGSYSF